jgi:hypothetical protein
MPIMVPQPRKERSTPQMDDLTIIFHLEITLNH